MVGIGRRIICNVHDVAVATNLSTAELLIRGLDDLRVKASDGHEARRPSPLESAPKSRPLAAASRLDA